MENSDVALLSSTLSEMEKSELGVKLPTGAVNVGGNNLVGQQCMEINEDQQFEKDYFEWADVQELKDLNSRIIIKTPEKGRFHLPNNSKRMMHIEPHTYGELIVLGYRSYQISSNQELLPVGTANDRYLLQSKSIQTDINPHCSIILKPNMINSEGNFYPVCGIEARHEVPRDPAVDTYQIGRSEVSTNDFIVQGVTGDYDEGHVRVSRPSVSRYSCRIVCYQTSPSSCRIFAGGFDEKQELRLPLYSMQWKEEDGRVDGFPNTAIQVWHPIYKQWFEVSIMGNAYGPRKAFRISEQIKCVPGERLPFANELLDGSIIDVGGCFLLYKRFDNELATKQEMRVEDMNIIIKTMNEHRPHCPVLFHPLEFSRQSVKEKQHRMWKYVKSAHHLPKFSRNAKTPEMFLEEQNQTSTPYVFSSCGHVYGYSRQLEGRPCPLCRKVGPYVPLILSSCAGFSATKPTHVFNPCGHASSHEICILWSQIPLPDLMKGTDLKYYPRCPFCLTKLDPVIPFSKLIILFDERLEDA